MPIINFERLSVHNPIDLEPYQEFLKRYKKLKGNINGEQITIDLQHSEGFASGFNVDNSFVCDPALEFSFAEQSNGILLKIDYSLSCAEDNFFYYMAQAKQLKKRVPYFFIPGVNNLAFTSSFSERFTISFCTYVPDKVDVPNICCSLIGLIIAIFSLDS